MVGAYINRAVQAGEVDAIVLGAGAHAARENLDKTAAAAVARSMSKDFTNIPDRELAVNLR